MSFNACHDITIKRLEYLKALKATLESASEEKFLKMLTVRTSQKWAEFVSSLKMESAAKELWLSQINRELADLEG